MIKSIRLTLLGMLTLLLSTAVQLSAEPTINGPSGLVTMPTAESLEYQQFNFALDYKMANQVQERFYSFNMGMFKNVELGITGGSTPTEGVFVNAKYFLISDNGRFPLTFAVG
ncbi:hypothetical protein EBR96_10405, partial [bacterium]|nr:hypothetical protein [bacterium]